MPDTTSDDLNYRVYVVELADTIGPRRHPDLPNVYVGATAMDPDERFRLDRRPSAKPRKGVRDHGLRLRPDLVPEQIPMTWSGARERRAALIKELSRQGYTVNGSRTVWRLYVIELSDGPGTRANPDLPWVYVGQTTLTPEERFEQHRSGTRTAKGRRLHSKWPHGYGIRLRPDLYERESVRYDKDDALAAEAALAERLEREGYSVKGGH